MADDAETFLSIAGLADRVGVSDSTIRNWRRRYRDLIPEHLGADGVRRYPLATFQQIAIMRERRLPPETIRAALPRAPVATNGPPAPEAAILDRLDRILALLERIADRLDREGE